MVNNETSNTMTPEERFRASSQLLFVAPDVPPIAPRPRRSELRRLDDVLDREFARDFAEDPEPRAGIAPPSLAGRAG